MKRFIILALAIALVLPCMAMAQEEDVVVAIDGRRLMTTTYSADYTVSSSIVTSTEAVTLKTLYAARITIRDNAAKKQITAWEAAATSSTPDLAGVAGGTTYWSSTPSESVAAAYTASINEAWKVGKVCAAGGKLVQVNGINTFDTKTGTIKIDLLTAGLPTATWTP